jgi:hypothetical protein
MGGLLKSEGSYWSRRLRWILARFVVDGPLVGSAWRPRRWFTHGHEDSARGQWAHLARMGGPWFGSIGLGSKYRSRSRQGRLTPKLSCDLDNGAAGALLAGRLGRARSVTAAELSSRQLQRLVRRPGICSRRAGRDCSEDGSLTSDGDGVRLARRLPPGDAGGARREGPAAPGDQQVA